MKKSNFKWRSLRIIRLHKKMAKKLGANKWSSGFSFIETLAVLAVTAVLASQAGAACHNLLQKARVTSAKTQIESLKVALQTYYVDCGSFPTTEQGLNALWEKPYLYPVSNDWDGPYIEKKLSKDPWGNEYVYVKNGDGLFPENAPLSAPFVIVSLGSDGVYGGNKGAEVDIVSWE